VTQRTLLSISQFKSHSLNYQIIKKDKSKKVINSMFRLNYDGYQLIKLLKSIVNVNQLDAYLGKKWKGGEKGILYFITLRSNGLSIYIYILLDHLNVD
jgi:hypothetical protein